MSGLLFGRRKRNAKSGVVGIGCEESRECCFPTGRGLPAHAHYGPKTEEQQETNNKQNKNTGTNSVKPGRTYEESAG